MESGTKALIMAAGVLLAMIVIGFVIFTFNRMGQWQTTQEQEVLIQQTDKFNNEFQAYDKDLMYGVDLISCLNKAKSINDQIEQREKINGNTYDESYKINIKFTLKSPLTESIRVYHIKNGKVVSYSNDEWPNDDRKLIDIFPTITQEYETKIQGGTDRINFHTSKIRNYPNGTTKIGKENGIEEYILLDSNDAEKIEALLTCANSLKQTVKNKEDNKSAEDGWVMAEWETALYKMKMRKYTCSKVEFNATTGRINYMEFNEY